MSLFTDDELVAFLKKESRKLRSKAVDLAAEKKLADAHKYWDRADGIKYVRRKIESKILDQF